MSRNPLWNDPSESFLVKAVKALGSAVGQSLGIGVSSLDALNAYHAEQKGRLLSYLEKDAVLAKAPFLYEIGSRKNKAPSKVIQELIFDKHSNLYMIESSTDEKIAAKFRELGQKIDKHSELYKIELSKYEEIAAKFRDLEKWMPKPLPPNPSINDHKMLFSVRQLLLIQAIHALYDPIYESTADASAKKSWESVHSKLIEMKGAYGQIISEQIAAAQKQVDAVQTELDDVNPFKPLPNADTNVRLKLAYARRDLEAAKSATVKTLEGKNITDEIDAVCEYVTRVKDAVFINEFLNYQDSIPVGAHIMYDFTLASFHAFHHAIYVGYNAVVEILNFKDDKGKMASFQTVTHIHDFIRRAINLTKMSPIVIRLYDNPLPPEVIVKRAMWTLGKYPGYRLEHENCETVASWIASNQYKEEHYCMNPATKFVKMEGERFAVNAPMAAAVVARGGAGVSTRKRSRRGRKSRKSHRRR